MAWSVQESRANTLKGIGRVKPVSEGLKIKMDSWDAPSLIVSKNVPENCKGREGKFMISCSGKKDFLYSLHPVKGIFKVKFTNWSMKKDQTIPQPARMYNPHAKSKDGGEYVLDYLYMVALLEIQEGEHKGLTIPYLLRYNFSLLEMAGDEITQIKGSGKYSKQLIDFLEATGLWEEALPWSDNLLPEMAKRIRKANRVLLVTLKDGYVDSLISEDEPDLSDDEDMDDEGDDVDDDEVDDE